MEAYKLWVRKNRDLVRSLESLTNEKEVEVSSVARESPAPTLPAACLDAEVVVRVTCTCGVHKVVSFDHCH